MKLNVENIKLRLEKLERYIKELKKHQKLSRKRFLNNSTVQLAVERAFQAGIESCVDIANHIIAVYQLKRPEEQKEVFLILARAGYIDDTYASAMAEMVKMRNRIVHLYWDIDLERLYQYLKQDTQLLERFRTFVIQLLEAEETENDA